MSNELISIYLYSTIAQTLGALIGIGIIVLTFQAQWSNNRREELREHLCRLGNELSNQLQIGNFDYVGSDVTLVQRINTGIDKLPDTDIRKKELKEYLVKYQGFKPVISNALFVICLIISLATITGAVACIFCLKSVGSSYTLIILIGFFASIILYSLLALQVVRMITKGIFRSKNP